MRELSPALRTLVGQLMAAKGEVEERAAAYHAASKAEGDAERHYKRLAARKKLLARGSVKEREWAAEADDEVNEAWEAWHLAIALRREMKVGADLSERMIEAAQAAFNAYNRELKVEESVSR